MIWKCKDYDIEYGDRVLVMGIVNVTPDSFSDGGCYYDVDSAVKHALMLDADGADILDLGAQSTRPNYSEITPEEEWARLKGVITTLRPLTDKPISVDTYYPYVAENALKAGANIINDISGKVTRKMAEIVNTTHCGWVLTHNGATSSTKIAKCFDNIICACENYGVDKNQLCLDPGIGFGKNYEQDLDLIVNIPKYKRADMPLLLGVSRKRVIGRASGQSEPSQRIYGNIAADTVAVLGGVDIIRLHDVKNEIQGISTARELKKAGVSLG